MRWLIETLCGVILIIVLVMFINGCHYRYEYEFGWGVKDAHQTQSEKGR